MSTNIIQLIIIWYLLIFPVAPITVHNGAETASNNVVIIVSCVNVTAYIGTSTSQSDNISSQQNSDRFNKSID